MVACATYGVKTLVGIGRLVPAKAALDMPDVVAVASAVAGAASRAKCLACVSARAATVMTTPISRRVVSLVPIFVVTALNMVHCVHLRICNKWRRHLLTAGEPLSISHW